MKTNDPSYLWVQDFVVGESICPFAVTPWSEGRVLLYNDPSPAPSDQVMTEKLQKLQKDQTLLVAFPEVKENFDEFYQWCNRQQKKLQDSGYDVLVIAFHPNFQFMDTDFDEVINLVNRSPYPMAHILWRDELFLAQEQALELNAANEEKLKAMPKDKIKKLFPHLYHD